MDFRKVMGLYEIASERMLCVFVDRRAYAYIARHMRRRVVCLSVCPSVTQVRCVKNG